MTFESGLLPTRHFLEANTTHSFYSVVPSYAKLIEDKQCRTFYARKNLYNNLEAIRIFEKWY
jgi:hypothetical protein